MIYIPPDRKISIVPDLEGLPAKISLPRDKRHVLPLLILSGCWLIVAPFVVIFGPWTMSGWPLVLLFSIGFAITALALIAGMAALRRNASQDEITLYDDHIAIRRYGWLRTTDREVAMFEIAMSEVAMSREIAMSKVARIITVRQTVRGGKGNADYFVVGLKLEQDNGGADVLPLFIHRDEPRAEQFAKRLQALVATAHEKAGREDARPGGQTG